MNRRGTLPVTRPVRGVPLVHAIPGTGGGDRQLVVRVTVGTEGDAGDEPSAAVRGMPFETSPPTHAGAGSTGGGVDLPRLCSELTRALSHDLDAAMAVVADAGSCPVVLLRPDRTVLAGGEPGRSGGSAMTGLPARSWRWAANGPRSDREMVLGSGTRRLGVLAFQRAVPDQDGPVWELVRDVLALALQAHDAHRRAEAAEVQAALLACLTDGDRERPLGTDADRPSYRPAVISPTGTPWTPELSARIARRVAGEPLLGAARFAQVEDRGVCLYPQQPDSGPREHAEAWHRVTAAAGADGCRVAVGEAGARGPGLQDCYRTAHWLADLQATPRPGMRMDTVAVVDELGVVAGALGPGWGPRVGHFVRRVLGDLVDNPRFGGEMVDTLHAYLVSGGSPTEAARIRHLSPSSMKYRMRIIRDTLGDRLLDHDSVFEIELALRLLKAFEARPAGTEDIGRAGSGPAVSRCVRPS